MPTKLETYIAFKPNIMVAYFDKHGWEVKTVPITDTQVVSITKGAALECGDGRFDSLPNRTKISNLKPEEGLEVRGVRILGGVNAVMSMLTGGDRAGLDRATDILRRNGVAPGTHSAEHGGCGYADLWIAGGLETARYPYELDEVLEKGSGRIGVELKRKMRELGGRHFRLNGEHEEKGVRVNPFIGTTELAYDGSRFRVDDWFMASLGLPDVVRWAKIEETVRLLKPDARALEIIVP